MPVFATFGDSVMHGVRPGVTEAQTFRALFAVQYGLTGLDQGVPGNTSRDMLARLPAALAARPNYVAVMAGINDVATGLPPFEYLANMRAIVAGFLGVGARVALMTPWLWRTYLFLDQIAPYNGAVSIIAAEKAVLKVDVYDRCWQEQLLLPPAQFDALWLAAYSDWQHPSSAGNQMITALTPPPNSW
jgi:lysophospholipase L1-like esterase